MWSRKLTSSHLNRLAGDSETDDNGENENESPDEIVDTNGEHVITDESFDSSVINSQLSLFSSFCWSNNLRLVCVDELIGVDVAIYYYFYYLK